MRSGSVLRLESEKSVNEKESWSAAEKMPLHCREERKTKTRRRRKEAKAAQEEEISINKEMRRRGRAKLSNNNKNRETQKKKKWKMGHGTLLGPQKQQRLNEIHVVVALINSSTPIYRWLSERYRYTHTWKNYQLIQPGRCWLHPLSTYMYAYL